MPPTCPTRTSQDSLSPALIAEGTDAAHQLVIERFITACANGDFQALAAALDPSIWGAATLLGEPAPPQQVNYGIDAVAAGLLF